MKPVVQVVVFLVATFIIAAIRGGETITLGDILFGAIWASGIAGGVGAMMTGSKNTSKAAMSPASTKNDPAVLTKKCPQCAELIQLDALECHFCGHPFEVGAVQKQVTVVQQKLHAETEYERQRKIQKKLTILSAILFGTNGLCLLLQVCNLFILLIPPSAGTEPLSETAYVMLGSLTLIFSALATLGMISAWSIGKRKYWGRKAAVIFGIGSLLLFPLGTILGIYTLVVMSSKEVKELFERGRVMPQPITGDSLSSSTPVLPGETV